MHREPNTCPHRNCTARCSPRGSKGSRQIEQFSRSRLMGAASSDLTTGAAADALAPPRLHMACVRGGGAHSALNSGARPAGGLRALVRNYPTGPPGDKKKPQTQSAFIIFERKLHILHTLLRTAHDTVVENGRVGHRLEVTASSPGARFGLLLSDQARHMPPGPCRRPEPTRASSRPRAPSQSGRA